MSYFFRGQDAVDNTSSSVGNRTVDVMNIYDDSSEDECSDASQPLNAEIARFISYGVHKDKNNVNLIRFYLDNEKSYPLLYP